MGRRDVRGRQHGRGRGVSAKPTQLAEGAAAAATVAAADQAAVTAAADQAAVAAVAAVSAAIAAIAAIAAVAAVAAALAAAALAAAIAAAVRHYDWAICDGDVHSVGGRPVVGRRVT